MKKVLIYTDGGCHPNPGFGGWSAILSHGQFVKEISGGDANATCNKMELVAALQALKTLKYPCEVTLKSDSLYLINGMSKWIEGWEKKNFCLKNKTPLKNQDLWKELFSLSKIHKIKWKWVKGHSGNPSNERCDTLCSIEIAKIKNPF